MPPRKLSAEDRRLIDDVCAPLIAKAFCTEPIEPEACRKAAGRAYELAGFAVPQVIFCRSPFEAMSRLQALNPETNTSTTRPVPDVEDILKDGTRMGSLWDVIAAAQPRKWPALGEEVDLTFHDEVNRLLDFDWSAAGAFRTAKSRVDAKTVDLGHLSGPVSDALERQVREKSEAWLLHTQASASVWDSVVDYATLDVAIALGHVDAATPEYAAGHQVIESCGWLYSFERLCLVCERPVEVGQSKKGREVRSTVTWRDGIKGEWVFI